LPENVRITAVQPRLEKDGRFIIGMRVEAKEIGDLEKFLDELEMTGAFHNVLTTDEQATDDGLLEAVIEGSYVQQAASAAAGEKSVATATTDGGRALSD
jgi:hypothetical protein